MARMYSRKKGKSGSTKPSDIKKKSWVKYDAKEIEALVLKLTKELNKPSKIGMILRDSYGIADVKIITGKSISKLLEKNKIAPELPEDIASLIKKQVFLLDHLDKNHKDETAKRGLILTESKINRLMKYYKKAGRLPKTWKYDRDKAKLLIN